MLGGLTGFYQGLIPWYVHHFDFGDLSFGFDDIEI
jgi:hypothetical protein